MINMMRIMIMKIIDYNNDDIYNENDYYNNNDDGGDDNEVIL